MSQPPTRNDFRREVKRIIDKARNEGYEYVDIVSGDVHRSVGGYPSPDSNHRMPLCCEAMYDYKKELMRFFSQRQVEKVVH